MDSMARSGRPSCYSFSMPRQHHRTTERLRWIDAQIRAGGYPSTRTIAERFEITRKTAQRDIDFMRDRMGAPIEYSHERRGFFYSEAFSGLPAVVVTEGELVAILMAERLAREYAGTPLADEIHQAMAKVASALTEAVSIDFSILPASWSVESLPTIEVEKSTFRDLTRAIHEQRVVEMVYYTATRGETTTRRVEPLHLRNYQGDWYLVAYDFARSEVRVFLVGRVRDLQVTETPCEARAEVDVAKFLDSSFQMFVGSDPVDVVLEFDEHQARWIRERRLPHESATTEELDGGRLRLSMRVLSIEAVRRYVLQYGSRVTVVAPETLRAEIRREAEAVLKQLE